MVSNLLSNPLVHKYFRILFMNAANAFVSENEIKGSDDEKAVLAFFNKVKGVQMVCTMLVNSFQPPKPKKEEGKT